MQNDNFYNPQNFAPQQYPQNQAPQQGFNPAAPFTPQYGAVAQAPYSQPAPPYGQSGQIPPAQQYSAGGYADPTSPYAAAPAHTADSYYQAQYGAGYGGDPLSYQQPPQNYGAQQPFGSYAAPQYDPLSYQQPPQNYGAQQPFGSYAAPQYDPLSYQQPQQNYGAQQLFGGYAAPQHEQTQYRPQYDQTQYQPQYEQTQYRPQYDQAQFQPQYDPLSYQQQPQPQYDPAQYQQAQQGFGAQPSVGGYNAAQQPNTQSIFEMIDDLTKKTESQLDGRAPKQQTMDDLLASVGDLSGSPAIFKVGDDSTLKSVSPEEKPAAVQVYEQPAADEAFGQAPAVDEASEYEPEHVAPVDEALGQAPAVDEAFEYEPEHVAPVDEAFEYEPEHVAPVEQNEAQASAADDLSETELPSFETAFGAKTAEQPADMQQPFEAPVDFDIFSAVEQSMHAEQENGSQPGEDIVESLDEAVQTDAVPDGAIDADEIRRLSEKIDREAAASEETFAAYGADAAEYREPEPEPAQAEEYRPEIDFGEVGETQETKPEQAHPVFDFGDIAKVVDSQLKYNAEKQAAFGALFGEANADIYAAAPVEEAAPAFEAEPEPEIVISPEAFDMPAEPVISREFFVPRDFGENAVETSALSSRLCYITDDERMIDMVSGVTLAVPRGAVCAFCAPRQYDAFALLEILGGAMPFESGSYTINGETISSKEQVEMPNVFYIDEVSILDVPVKLRDFLLLSLAKSCSEDFVDNVMRELGIADIADTNVNILSTTQKAIVLTLAAAISPIVDTIILNVPEIAYSARDDGPVKKLFRLASDAGKTVLFSCIDRMFVQSYASHLIVTKDGSMIFNGTMREFYETYSTGGADNTFEQIWVRAVRNV